MMGKARVARVSALPETKRRDSDPDAAELRQHMTATGFSRNIKERAPPTRGLTIVKF